MFGCKTVRIFAGDFFYQESLQEKVSPQRLLTAIKNIVLYAIDQRKVVPRRLIVIRDGISEGQYDMAIANEIPAIKKGFETALREANEVGGQACARTRT